MMFPARPARGVDPNLRAEAPLGPISIPPLRSNRTNAVIGVLKMFSRTVTVDLNSTHGPTPSRRDSSL